MLDLTDRLRRRIERDFPDQVDEVLDWLRGLDDLVVSSHQNRERMFAAVLRYASGRLDKLRDAAALARSDWRDLLIVADLAHADWPDRLTAWLDQESSATSSVASVSR